MSKTPTVFVSSTFEDLRYQRRVVMDACLTVGAIPIGIESLPVTTESPLTTIQQSITKADIFVGIIGFRYGFIPSGAKHSVTELEYELALAEDIPRIIFLMGDKHPLQPEYFDRGDTADKLETFKNNLMSSEIVKYFNSPEELSALARIELSRLISGEENIASEMQKFQSEKPPLISHPVYMASKFINREEELHTLEKWALRERSNSDSAPVLILLGIGGIGKTALAWKFFTGYEKLASYRFSGRLWWSFYENKSFQDILLHAFEYFFNSEQSNEQMDRFTQISRLIDTLNKNPYLVVLDGLEELLVGFSDRDTDTPAKGSRTSHFLRKVKDAQAAMFLNSLGQIKASKILITTRIVPVDLEDSTGSMLPGYHSLPLEELSSQDTINLLREYGIRGSQTLLADIASKSSNHPLVTRLLAAQFADKPAEIVFPDDLTQGMTLESVMRNALDQLSAEAFGLLKWISESDSPVPHGKLTNELVGSGKSFKRESDLDRVLTNLEDRGLIMWDQIKNQYSVHPVTKALITNLNEEIKTEEEIFILLNNLKDQGDTEETLLKKANDIIQLQPNFFGIGVDLNELIRKLLSKK